MRFAAYLALIGAAVAVKMTQVPQDDTMLDLDLEAEEDLMEDEAVGKCADPGVQALVDFWQGMLDANRTMYMPKFKGFKRQAGKACKKAGVSCPSGGDLKKIFDSCEMIDRKGVMVCSSSGIIAALNASDLC